MKNYLAYLLFVLSFFSSPLYSNSFNIPGIISSALNNEGSKASAPATTFDAKNVDDLLAVLKDAKQLELLIKSLELLKTIPQAELAKPSNKATPPINFGLPNGDIIEEYTAIGELTSFGTSSVKTIVLELKDIIKNRSYYWGLWIAWLFFGMAIFFFVENILHIFLKLDKSKVLNQLNLKKNKKKYNDKYGKYGIYYNVAFFLIHLFKLCFPAILSSVIAIAIINSIITIEYSNQIIEILILLLFVRVFLYFFNIIFRQFKKHTFKQLDYWIHMFVYIVFTFLVFNNLFLQEYMKNNGLLLIKINLLIFVVLLILVFFKIKVLVVKIISRGFFQDNIEGRRNLPYRYFVLLVKKYYILLVSLLLISILSSVLLLQYSVAQQIILRVFVSMFFVVGIYILHKISINIFYDRVIHKVQDNLDRYSKSSQEFALSYQYLSINKMWIFFHYTYNFINIYILVRILDYIWSLGVVDIINGILKVKLLKIIFGMYVGVGVLLFITLIILLLVQKIVLNAFVEDDINKVKKILSIFVLCNKPYKILFGLAVLIIFLSVIGVPISALIASTGAFAIVFAFLTKDLLKNFANALMFFLEDAFSLNDLVEIDNRRGVLESMSLVYIRLRDSDGKLHLIPFADIKTITNYSKDFAYAQLDIGISYDSDPEKAIEIINNIYNELILTPLNDVILGPLEVMGVTNLGEYSINIRTKVRTLGGKQFMVRNEFFKQIHKQFKQNNIEIPYPHTVILKK